MKQSTNNLDHEDMIFPSINECPVAYNDGVYDILLDEEIKQPSYYRNAYQALRCAKSDETVRIIISSPGGYLTSAIIFKNLIEDCAATVIGVLEGEAFSAGSMILLSCPNIRIQPYTTLMCHSAAFGSAGMVQQVRDHVEFTGRNVEAVMEEVYQDFLSPEEFGDLKKGVEIWLDYDQISQRLEKMFDARDARAMEMLGEEEKALDVMSLIETQVEKGVDKALKKLYSKFDIVPKPAKTPTKAKQSPPHRNPPVVE